MTDKAMVTDAERAWNAMSDDMNRWDMLSEDERETFTAFAAVLAQAEQPVALASFCGCMAGPNDPDPKCKDCGGTGAHSAVYAVARRIYEDAHKGMSNIWIWDDQGLDDEHPGTRDRYLCYARSAIAALAHPPAKREAGETLKPRDNVVVDSVFGPVGGIIVEPVEGWWKVQFRDGSIAVVRPSSIRAALEASHE